MGWSGHLPRREKAISYQEQVKAYPVNDSGHQVRLEIIHRFLSTIPNFQSVGRNGIHRYNNQDDSIFMAMLAAKNLI
jgi:protoporphyrinogen oxidase